jgi:signal transduction histidine kinase
MASELVISGRLADQAKRDRVQRMMHSEIQRLACTVDDLISLARIQSGPTTDRWGTVSLELLCREAVDTYTWLVDTRRIELSVHVPVEVTIQGDRCAIGRMIHNLLGNAAKATVTGSIRILVDAVLIDHRPFARITVSDTGTGIDPALAVPLKRALAGMDHQPSRDFLCRHGLGLSIISTIAWAHGGSVSFESTHASLSPHSGTSFHVLLRADLSAPKSDDR